MLAAALLWLSAANWLAVGLSSLLFPRATAALLDMELRGTASASDMRAVYGGLRIGLGIFLAWAASSDQLRVGLTAAALLFGGNVFGRFCSLLLDGSPGRVTRILLGFEVLGLALVSLALAELSSPAA